uniref:C2H2-type domain-containing protein n=1 Tax=Mycena chlorophos TaxID=658473 RepID=A0ABQ0LAQ8_MYCCL|nr:predicted protein [Mycena chlorophos]
MASSFRGTTTTDPDTESTTAATKSRTSARSRASSSRDHQCSYCPKIFSTSGHLSRHVRVHTGEMNYSCSFPGCTTRCSRKDNLRQHYRLHFDIRDPEELKRQAPNKKRRKTRVQRVSSSLDGTILSPGGAPMVGMETRMRVSGQPTLAASESPPMPTLTLGPQPTSPGSTSPSGSPQSSASSLSSPEIQLQPLPITQHAHSQSLSPPPPVDIPSYPDPVSGIPLVPMTKREFDEDASDVLLRLSGRERQYPYSSTGIQGGRAPSFVSPTSSISSPDSGYNFSSPSSASSSGSPYYHYPPPLTSQARMSDFQPAPSPWDRPDIRTASGPQQHWDTSLSPHGSTPYPQPTHTHSESASHPSANGALHSSHHTTHTRPASIESGGTLYRPHAPALSLPILPPLLVYAQDEPERFHLAQQARYSTSPSPIHHGDPYAPAHVQRHTPPDVPLLLAPVAIRRDSSQSSGNDTSRRGSAPSTSSSSIASALGSHGPPYNSSY